MFYCFSTFYSSKLISLTWKEVTKCLTCMFLFAEINCETFSIANGKVKFSYITFNMKVSISCDVGYRLRGPSVVTCGANSSWTPALPTCEEGKTLLDWLYNNCTVQYCGLPFALCASRARTGHMPAPSRAQQQRTGRIQDRVWSRRTRHHLL